MKQEKTRYLQFTVQSDAPLSPDDVKHACYEAVFGLWGEEGASRARITLVTYSPSTKVGVLSCRLERLEHTIAALALKTRFSSRPIALRLTRLSGTLRALGVKRKTRF